MIFVRRDSSGASSSINRASDADRKSTRLNSSHGYISYDVFCLQKNSRALDDGPAVGEKRHFVRVVPELQHEVVMTHHTMRLQPETHFGKIDGPMAFMDLHGVTP